MVCNVYRYLVFIRKYFLQNVFLYTQSSVQGQAEYGPVEQSAGKKPRVYTLSYHYLSFIIIFHFTLL